jgi:hypothetical protein
MMQMVISRICFIPYERKNANKGSALSAEKCIVKWDNLDGCANRIPEPFRETNNEHGKGENNEHGKGENPQTLSRHKSQDDEEYI